MTMQYAVPYKSSMIPLKWNTGPKTLGASNIIERSPAASTKDKFSPPQQPRNPSRKQEPTVENLSYSFLSGKLAPCLDRHTADANGKENNIFALALSLDFDEDQITHLRNCYYGGGNPAASFLLTMFTELCDVPVSQLKNCLKEDGMPPKALEVIMKYNEHKTFDDISPADVQALAYKLTIHNKSYKDWRAVAEQFGYGDKIPLFEIDIHRNNIYSPTMAFAEMLRIRRPNTTVSELIEKLIALNNTEAVQLLTETI